MQFLYANDNVCIVQCKHFIENRNVQSKLAQLLVVSARLVEPENLD